TFSLLDLHVGERAADGGEGVDHEAERGREPLGDFKEGQLLELAARHDGGAVDKVRRAGAAADLDGVGVGVEPGTVRVDVAGNDELAVDQDGARRPGGPRPG